MSWLFRISFRPSRRLAGALLAAAFLGLLPACQSRHLRLTAEQEKVRARLTKIDPARDRLAAETRVIDIHTHTFNARYLPLRNILLGKRDVFPPVSWLISDCCARTLARALCEKTELAPAGGQPECLRSLKTRPDEDHEAVCGVLLRLLDRIEKAGAWNKDIPHRTRMEKLDQVIENMSPQERLGLRAAGHMMGMDESLKDVDPQLALRGLGRFLWMLTQNDEAMTRLHREEYADVPMQGSPLMVSHMMDLGPVYDQEPDNEELLDFVTQQIPRVEAFQKKPDSGMIYFVAYNPYRDHWSNGNPGDALRIVKNAVAQHGAWGVKIYPPSGYRPAGNQIKPRARAPLSAWPGREWDARYRGLGAGWNAELDRRLQELLLWCIANDLPVFVHCGTGEFEARKGYGLYHSDPRFWRRFLESHPAPDGSPCRLRLCLGHAGGDDFWFGGTRHADWGREVHQLCMDFPNVYCEITTHHALLDPERQAFFASRLMRLFDAHSTYKPGGPFSRKLLYGTDWYLPDARERRDLLKAAEQVFLLKELRGHYQNYFHGNALRYLNVRQRLNHPSFPPPAEVETRLRKYLTSVSKD